MHLNHKPGEILQVDWAGDTAAIVDPENGEIIPAYVFVATLPCSAYSYVEAFLSMDQEAWTTAHVNAFNYFGGVARMIQCDNLKTGVEKHGHQEIILNRAYQELAEHYLMSLHLPYGNAGELSAHRLRVPQALLRRAGSACCSRFHAVLLIPSIV